MKQPIPTHSSPFGNATPSPPVYACVVRTTRALIEEQLFVHGGGVSTRFLHALCSEGQYMRASRSASRTLG